MAMSNYYTIPKTTPPRWVGKNIFLYDNNQPYSIAYVSAEEQSLRVAIYKTGIGGDYPLQIVIYSPYPIDFIDVSLISPYGVIVKSISEIKTPLPDNLTGYYNSIMFQRERLSTGYNGLKWYRDDINELFRDISVGDEPSGESGVVVTVIATPLEPSDEGVIVHAIANILDPNQQGGESEPGGGQGTFDDTSDPIPVPELPSISVVNTGLVTLFRPSQLELSQLGAYLWTHLNDFWENLQKLFTNPMDYFIAFNIFPVNPQVSGARKVYIGNWGTDIYMRPVTNQWYEFDCGTVLLPEYWGSALDYMPNTKVQLMLPYIGSVQLNTDEVMGHRIGVKYRIDLLSGSCVAMVTVNDNVYYQFTGECAVAVPLTGADWSRVYSAVVGAIGTAIAGGVGAVATGNAGGAAMSAFAAGKATYAAGYAGQNLAKVAEVTKGMRGAPAMRQALTQAMQASAQAATNAATASGTVANGIRATRLANTVNNTVGQVMSGKSVISHSGTISGSSGMLGVRNAYLIIEYPNQSLADKYRHFAGYPSNMYAKLGDLHGYTEVEQVIPEGIWGTDDELAELIEALKGGVYL